jgi:predicted metal-dependent HD superfamily phosphohydrolase
MDLIQQSEQFVSTLLKERLPSQFTYHNFNHTFAVVQAVTKIANYEQIKDEDTKKLLIAAWFHDVGYVHGHKQHEATSAEMATDFLKQHSCSESFILEVSQLIMATTFCHQPQGILEQIICDADFFHFADEQYLTICESLRLEWQNTCQKSFSDLEWSLENLNILTQKHQYHTSFALQFWQPVKEKNITRLQKKIKKLTDVGSNMVVKSKKDRVEKPEKTEKLEKSERGIDTLFRVTLSNHTRLSEIADSKANILLSVNAIIISISLSTLIPKLDSPSNAHLIIPTFVLVLFSVVTIIFAILSTRPKVTSGTFTPKDIEDRKVNLLFFGNFYKMPYQEYENAVNEMMKDRQYLYNSMIKDLYYLGLVLERKYRLLRITYNVFMVGIIVSVLTFVIAFKTSGL